MSEFYKRLREIEAAGNLRRLPAPSSAQYIDLSGNDYLGFAAESALLEEEFLSLHRGSPLLFTSAASRLLSTRQESHLSLEEELEEAYGRPVLLFNSGYHANVGVSGSLGSLPGTVFLADKLVHASIIDGLKLSGNPFFRFRHNDMQSLKKLIERHQETASRIVIITESVFSMDGDLAPLDELAEIRKGNPKTLLYVDEAHAFGVFGPSGLGLASTSERKDYIDIIIGTFGKAAASFGAFAVCSQDMKEWFVNTSRPLIFSTALPPVNIEWTRFIFKKILKAEKRRERLKEISESFRNMISEFGNRFCADNSTSTISRSQIVPLMTGSSERAVKLSRGLRDRGILALPIRRPTVPPGTERIRFSLNASLTDEAIEETANTLLALGESGLFY